LRGFVLELEREVVVVDEVDVGDGQIAAKSITASALIAALPWARCQFAR